MHLAGAHTELWVTEQEGNPYLSGCTFLLLLVLLTYNNASQFIIAKQTSKDYAPKLKNLLQLGMVVYTFYPCTKLAERLERAELAGPLNSKPAQAT